MAYIHEGAYIRNFTVLGVERFSGRETYVFMIAGFQNFCAKLAGKYLNPNRDKNFFFLGFKQEILFYLPEIRCIIQIVVSIASVKVARTYMRSNNPEYISSLLLRGIFQLCRIFVL